MVPSDLDTLDSELFSISEEIVREMIHNRHKYQRENHLKNINRKLLRPNRQKESIKIVEEMT